MLFDAVFTKNELMFKFIMNFLLLIYKHTWIIHQNVWKFLVNYKKMNLRTCHLKIMKMIDIIMSDFAQEIKLQNNTLKKSGKL